MKKAIIALVLVSIGIWFYCHWFMTFGTHKDYRYKDADAIFLPLGHVSVGLYESGFPYRLSFIYMLGSDDVAPPKRMIVENVVLIGCETKNHYGLGSLAEEVEHRIAVVGFEVKKKKGMKFEPYNLEALVRLVLEDGSEITQKVEYYLETDYRERDKIPRWHYLFM